GDAGPVSEVADPAATFGRATAPQPCLGRAVRGFGLGYLTVSRARSAAEAAAAARRVLRNARRESPRCRSAATKPGGIAFAAANRGAEPQVRCYRGRRLAFADDHRLCHRRAQRQAIAILHRDLPSGRAALSCSQNLTATGADGG